MPLLDTLTGNNARAAYEEMLKLPKILFDLYVQKYGLGKSVMEQEIDGQLFSVRESSEDEVLFPWVIGYRIADRSSYFKVWAWYGGNYITSPFDAEFITVTVHSVSLDRGMNRLDIYLRIRNELSLTMSTTPALMQIMQDAALHASSFKPFQASSEDLGFY